MIEISVRSNLKEIERSLEAFVRKQIPFATGRALTELAVEVKKAEVKNLLTKMPTATPFTQKSIGSTKANKLSRSATVYVRDVAASYLYPYEFGGLNKLNGSALLKPENVRLNKYGNLPRKRLAQLLSKPDVFVGKIKFKSGDVVDGIWQRGLYGSRRKGGYMGTKGKHHMIAGNRSTLTLLVRFADAHPAKPRLGYRVTAESLIARRFNKIFGRELARAMATAR
ncbi:hypothetical protein BI364_09530 [Acidihalobacter yilgarnensis]|uniref:Uncharacterized protein n=1 Tax=Acidihalobacter yilgarnensis TaxID=2819280 RepID=A0A1D8IP26_9GAMM|nr:hypothetical protein [Acidihalobacter yilgarnensis]AOU98155.1 hypothetical protein BI364_09470 [Acidihalobacter yilgarnensis]AOU98165.1 hypothetical protein BI364_09530 [Acidihalobacter yilgarnensis]